MCIAVYDENGELVYHGEADDFLFMNENDLVLEMVLDSMERTGKRVEKVFGYTIRKCSYED